MGVGILAIGVGLVGAWGVRSMLTQEEEPAPAPPARRPDPVPLAATNLPANRVIRLTDIALVPLSSQQMKERDFDLSQTILGTQHLIGRRLKEPLRAGRPFYTSGLFLEGEQPALEPKPGYRAVTIVSEAERAGALQTGDYVDVVFRSTPRRATDTSPAIPEKTVTLMRGVEVLRIYRPEVTQYRRALGYEDEAPHITVAVQPKQAAILQAVKGRGDITLTKVLNPGGAPDVLAQADDIKLEDILGVEPKPPEPAPAGPDWITEIYRRGQRNFQPHYRNPLWQGFRGNEAPPPYNQTTPPERS